MIRDSSFRPEARRIAVVKVQRPLKARIGTIGTAPPGRTSVTSWTPTAPAPADSSANWMSFILAQQNHARIVTPGTLSYTPASTTPAPNTAPWNSWIQPNCEPGATPATPGVDTSPGPATNAGSSIFWKLLGILGGAAASVYLIRSMTEDESSRRQGR